MFHGSSRIGFMLASLVLSVAFCGTSHAGLVTNGGFESGDWTGWTTSASFSSIVDDGSATGLTPHSGTYFAAMGDQPPPQSISQAISTVSGQSYTFSFWLGRHSDGKTPNYTFTALWGSDTVLSFNSATDSDTADFDYQLFSYNVIASSSSTTITFTNTNVPFTWTLDDVDVVRGGVSAVPEPGTVGLAILGGLTGLVARRRRAV